MTNQDRMPVEPDNGSASGKRVGDAERGAAVALLGEHWQAGRLDPGEHELRVTRARVAVTRGDLDALFVDLPGSGRAPESLPSSPQTRTGAGAPARPGRVPESRRETVMALMPFVALVLFFTTHTWLWFLMVPVAGIVLYGADGGQSGRHGWFWGRNRNRGC